MSNSPAPDSRDVRHRIGSPLLGPVVAAGAALIATAAALIFPPGTISELMLEDGPIETATVIGYGAALYIVWRLQHPVLGRKSAAAATVLLAVCLLKELGVRQPLLFAAGYPVRGAELTAWPNLLVAAFALALLPAGAWLLRQHGRDAFEGFKRGMHAPLTLASALVGATAAQVLDHLSKAGTERLDLTLSLRTRAVFVSLEEVLEMMLPMLVVLALLQLDAPRKATHR